MRANGCSLFAPPLCFALLVVNLLLVHTCRAFVIDMAADWHVPETATIGSLVGTARVLPSHVVTWKLSTSPFVIDGGGAVRTSSLLDFESQPTFVLTISASDGTSNCTTSLIIHVDDVNEAPVLSNFTWTAPRPVRSGTLLGTLLADDPDRPSQQLTWLLLSSSCGSAFMLRPLSGQLLFVASTISDTLCVLRVQVIDSGAKPLSTEAFVHVLLGADAHQATTNRLLIVSEDTQPSSVLTILSLPDTQGVAWSIETGNDGCAFSLDSATGQLLLQERLRTYVQSFYQLQLRAIATSVNVTAKVSIHVQASNQLSVAKAQNFTVLESTCVGCSVGEISAWNPDLLLRFRWTLSSGSMASFFTIAPETGALTVARELDFETHPEYTGLVTARDSAGASVSISVAVHTVDVNEPPEFQLQLLVVAENMAPVALGILRAVDPDFNQTVSWYLPQPSPRWRLNQHSGRLELLQPANYEQEHTLHLQVRACDNAMPSECSETTLDIQVTDVNEPHVLLSTTYHVQEGVSAYTCGPVQVSDPDSLPPRLHWRIETGVPFVIDAETGRMALTRALDYEIDGPTIQIVIMATDSAVPAISSNVTVTIVVDNANDPPQCPSAVSIREDAQPGAVIAQLTALDQDLPAQHLQWVLRNDPSGLFTISSSGAVTLHGHCDFETVPTYVIVAAVSDDGSPSQTAVCHVMLTVVDVNEPPQVAATLQLLVFDDASPGSVIGRVAGNDPDHGDVLQWQMESTSCPGWFSVDSSSGVLAVSNMPDASQREFCTLVVRVLDNGSPALSSRCEVQVGLRHPVRFTIAENNAPWTVLGHVPGVDGSWRLEESSDSMFFLLGSDDNSLLVSQRLDFEGKALYRLAVQQDDGIDASHNRHIMVHVLDINEPPCILPQTWSVSESLPSNSTVGTVAATDEDIPQQVLTFSLLRDAQSDSFQIDAQTGRISLKQQLDYEKWTSHALRVQVTDSGTPPATTTAIITVNVRDENEHEPNVWPINLHVAENSHRDTFVGQVLPWDMDIYQHQRLHLVGGDASNSFRLDSTSGKLTTFWPPNFEHIPRYWLRINVTDNGVPSLSAESTQVVDIIDVNEIPQIHNQIIPVREDTAIDEVIGNVQAFDMDIDQVLTFRVWPGDPSFVVGSASGNISLHLPLNYEQQQSYSMLVNVSDSGLPPMWNVSSIGIEVLDCNDVPLVSNATLFIDECPRELPPEAAMTQTPVPIKMWDVDTPAYPQKLAVIDSIMPEPSLDHVVFMANASGFVHLVNGSLDFERKQQYLLRVTVTDAHNSSNPAPPLTPVHQNTTVTIAIQVRDLNEKALVLAPNQLAVAEGAAIGTLLTGGNVVISDPDAQTLRMVLDDTAFALDHTFAPRFANLTRSPFQLRVNKAGLLSGRRVANLQAVDDRDPSKSSSLTPLVIIVQDINQQPEFVSWSSVHASLQVVGSSTNLTVAEATPANQPLLELVLFDEDARQLLTATVSKPYDAFISVVVNEEPAVLLQTNGPYDRVRRAKLFLLQDFLDFETVRTHQFTVCIQDDGRLLEITEDPNKISFLFSTRSTACRTFQMNVTDVPDEPEITGVSIPSETTGLNTVGGELVTISGRNLGPAANPAPGIRMPVIVDYSNGNATFTALNCMVSKAYTQIQCTSAAGYGRNYLWRVAIGSAEHIQRSSRFTEQSIHYALPVVSTFDGPGAANAPTKGGENITIYGSQFGSVAHQAITGVWYGPTGLEYAARQCRVIVDHTQIQCLLAAGVGANLQWTVEVAFQRSIFPTTSYAPPSIRSVHVMDGQSTSMSTAGSQVIRIDGDNFGRAQDNSIDKVIFGQLSTGRDQWSNAKQCKVIEDHVALQCLSAEGAGMELHWMAFVRGQSSAVSAVSLNYTAPSVAQVVPTDGSDHIDTAGITEVSVQGDNFGARTSPRSLLYNGRLITSEVVYLSPTTLRFVVPAGEGLSKPFRLLVEDQWSNEVVISYSRPTLSNVQVVSGFLPNPITIRIIGRNFGYCCSSVRSGQQSACGCIAEGACSCVPNGQTTVVVGSAPCANLTLLSDTEATCATFAVSGTIIMTTAHGTASKEYSYDAFLAKPVIDSVTCDDGSPAPSTAGGQVMHAVGSNFNLDGKVLGIVRTATKLLTLVLQHMDYSDTHVRFIAPPGQSDLQIVISIMGDARQSDPATVWYADPVIDAVNVTGGPANGGTPVRITGKNFGSPASALLVSSLSDRGSDTTYNRVLIGSRDCIVTFYSDTVIECLSPAGTGRNLPMTVHVAQFRALPNGVAFKSGVTSTTWRYNAPVVVRLEPSHLPTMGGEIDVVGENFGGVASEVQLLLGSALLPFNLQSHSVLRAKIPKGLGQQLPIVVRVSEQVSVEMAMFNYDPPNVTEVTVQASTTTYSLLEPLVVDAFTSVLTIRGLNFGDKPKPGEEDTAAVRLYRLSSGKEVRFPCSPVQHLSDGELRCTVKDVPVGDRLFLFVNVSSRVAVVAPSIVLRAECIPGYFVDNRVSPLCTACPANSRCAGKYDPPSALSGYWRDSGNWTTMRACYPADACSGSNQCNDGYDTRSDLCSACVDNSNSVIKYYQDASKHCVQCPDNANLIMAGIALAICAAGFGLYLLYKRAPSVAALTIFLDYLQIMSIFSDLDLRWPLPMLQFYQAASTVAINFDILSPECSVPVSFLKKWLFMEAVPLMITAALGMIALLHALRKVIACRKGPKMKHVDKLLGWWLISMNFSYMMVVRKAFEALLCRPGDGGVPVLIADTKVKCDQEDYLVIQKLAYAAIVVYGVGIPLLYACLLFPNSELIMVDQLLRLKGEANSKALNPFYAMQKRLRRLYYKFKPDKYYWTIMVLARKLAIIVIAATTKDNPLLSASSTALVLFAAYSSHVRSQPYLHDEHDPNAAAERAALIGAPLEPAFDASRSLAGLGSSITAKLPFLGGSGKARFLFDANLLEATCLACSIGLLMAGIMVKSFADMQQGSEPDVLTWIMVAVAVASVATCVVAVTGEVFASIRSLKFKPSSVALRARAVPIRAMRSIRNSFRGPPTHATPGGLPTVASARRSTYDAIALGMSKMLAVKDGVRHKLVVQDVVIHNIRAMGVYAGCTLKLRFILHPAQHVLTTVYEPSAELGLQAFELDVWHAQHDVLHIVVSLAAGLRSRIIGFASAAVNQFSQLPNEHIVEIRDAGNKVLGKLSFRIALLLPNAGAERMAMSTSSDATSTVLEELASAASSVEQKPSPQPLAAKDAFRPEVSRMISISNPMQRNRQGSITTANLDNPLARAARSQRTARQSATQAHLPAPADQHPQAEQPAAAVPVPPAPPAAPAGPSSSPPVPVQTGRVDFAPTSDVRMMHNPMRRA